MLPRPVSSVALHYNRLTTSTQFTLHFDDDNMSTEEEVKQDSREKAQQTETEPKRYEVQIVWRNVLFFAYIHYAAVHGLYLFVTSSMLWTNIWTVFYFIMGGLGITAGVHRLWSHRAYKAKWPLRALLAYFNLIAHQNDIYDWARDHRVHHKYSDTDADPHNASRGFFFSHVGWLLVRKHPQVLEKGRGIDMSDLEADPVVMFQRKYYKLLMPLASWIIPAVVPVYLWNESWTNAWHVASMFRYCFSLHMTWFVNSAAHMWGNKPYDLSIKPRENMWVAWGALGEGFHNYHHTFPWDYKTAELGDYWGNVSTAFIDFMSFLGLAYDLKTVAPDAVQRRSKRTGPGSAAHQEKAVWGWTDRDIAPEERSQAIIFNADKQN